jgi:Protein of unknown function (DUF1524)/Excalibur calcium-binding domain
MLTTHLSRSGRARRWVVGVAAIATGVLISGCQSAPPPAAEQTPASTAAANFAMPDLLGMVLQDAQDLLQTSGSTHLDQEDATGQERSLVVDANWTVCTQHPDSGTAVTAASLVTLGAVKLSEVCPLAEGTTPTPTPTPSPTPKAQPEPKVGPAMAAALALLVKGRAPKTGYSRAAFGTAWKDVDRNGCDTRNDMLRRDLAPVTVRAGTQGCLVVAGSLRDPYTAKTIAFRRGQTTSSAVQIDHVVALSDSWQKGAQKWSSAKRESFANDPVNLLAVQGSANMSKGDGDAATWLPSNKAIRCTYVARQVRVKGKYDLWVTRAEHDAIIRVLTACPDEGLVTEKMATQRKASTAAVAAAPKPKPAPQPKPAPKPDPAPQPPASHLDPQFRTCGDAIAAGYGPYVNGQDPEYDWYTDRDGDGVVCE